MESGKSIIFALMVPSCAFISLSPLASKHLTDTAPLAELAQGESGVPANFFDPDGNGFNSCHFQSTPFFHLLGPKMNKAS